MFAISRDRIEVLRLPTPAKYHGFSRAEINKCTFVRAKPTELDSERGRDGFVELYLKFLLAIYRFKNKFCLDYKNSYIMNFM